MRRYEEVRIPERDLVVDVSLPAPRSEGSRRQEVICRIRWTWWDK